MHHQEGHYYGHSIGEGNYENILYYYIAQAFAALHLQNPLLEHLMGSIFRLKLSRTDEKNSRQSQDLSPGPLGEKHERYLFAMLIPPKYEKIERRKGKKPSTQQDLNAQPLNYDSGALPLCCNRGPTVI